MLNFDLMEIVTRYYFTQKIVRMRTFFQISGYSQEIDATIEVVTKKLLALSNKPQFLRWLDCLYFTKKNQCFICRRKVTTKVHIEPKGKENWVVCRTCERSIPDYCYIATGVIKTDYALNEEDLKGIRSVHIPDSRYRNGYTLRLLSEVQDAYNLKCKKLEVKYLYAELNLSPCRAEMEQLQDGFFYKTVDGIFVRGIVSKNYVKFTCPFCFTRYKKNGEPCKNSAKSVHRFNSSKKNLAPRFIDYQFCRTFKVFVVE